MADHERDTLKRIQSRHIHEYIRRIREKNRPRTLEELKNMGRGSRTLIKKNLERRALDFKKRRNKNLNK